MSTRDAPEREAVLAKITKANSVVQALCDGTSKWIMRIPAQPGSDPDLVIGAALHAAEEFIRAQPAPGAATAEGADAEWLAWHAVDDQLNLILLRHGVPLRDVDMKAFRKALQEYGEGCALQPRPGGAARETGLDWWCPKCETRVPPEHVTYWEFHDERHGGCGARVTTTRPLRQVMDELRASLAPAPTEGRASCHDPLPRCAEAPEVDELFPHQAATVEDRNTAHIEHWVARLISGSRLEKARREQDIGTMMARIAENAVELFAEALAVGQAQGKQEAEAHVYELETRCDPAGDVRTITAMREQLGTIANVVSVLHEEARQRYGATPLEAEHYEFVVRVMQIAEELAVLLPPPGARG